MKQPRWKRPLDLSLLALGCVPAVACFLFLALTIWLADGGPVLYGQRRVGKGGLTFTAWKLRTMVPNAERLGPAWTVSRDPRITPAGRVLRRTGLDELPQLWNIARGAMSFIGPRPLAVAEVEGLLSLNPGFAIRHWVRPGLSGLAQLYDRSDDACAKIVFDLRYVGTMSLWLDLRLVLATVAHVALGRGDGRAAKVPSLR